MCQPAKLAFQIACTEDHFPHHNSAQALQSLVKGCKNVAAHFLTFLDDSFHQSNPSLFTIAYVRCPYHTMPPWNSWYSFITFDFYSSWLFFIRFSWKPCVSLKYFAVRFGIFWTLKLPKDSPCDVLQCLCFPRLKMSESDSVGSVFRPRSNDTTETEIVRRALKVCFSQHQMRVCILRLQRQSYSIACCWLNQLTLGKARNQKKLKKYLINLFSPLSTWCPAESESRATI